MTTITGPTKIAAPRKVQWLRAFKALRVLAKRNNDAADSEPCEESNYELIREFYAALDGGQQQECLEAFLAEQGAQHLLANAPDLAARLSDHEALLRMPNGSLGREYLKMALKDQLPLSLELGSGDYPADLAADQNATEKWFRDRNGVVHELLHLLSDYLRDPAGETGVLAFILALRPKRPQRVLWVGLLGAMSACPNSPKQFFALLRYVRQAYKRGAKARIPLAYDWENALVLPIEQLRKEFNIPTPEQFHPQGIWRTCDEGDSWLPENSALATDRFNDISVRD